MQNPLYNRLAQLIKKSIGATKNFYPIISNCFTVSIFLKFSEFIESTRLFRSNKIRPSDQIFPLRKDLMIFLAFLSRTWSSVLRGGLRRGHDGTSRGWNLRKIWEFWAYVPAQRHSSQCTRTTAHLKRSMLIYRYSRHGFYISVLAKQKEGSCQCTGTRNMRKKFKRPNVPAQQAKKFRVCAGLLTESSIWVLAQMHFKFIRFGQK